MSTFYDRLLEEKTQVDERLEKLNAFILSDKFNELHGIQMSLLNIQAQAMATYSQCLLERISWINAGENVSATN